MGGPVSLSGIFFFFTTRCELDKMCLIVQFFYVKRRFRAGMGVRGAAMFNFALCGWQSSGFALHPATQRRYVNSFPFLFWSRSALSFFICSCFCKWGARSAHFDVCRFVMLLAQKK